MKQLSPQELLKTLNWRYATKQFDSSRKISDADWNALEESLVLTPSSFGLQPWKFIVVKDPAVREKLMKASWNQTQVKEASHFVVFTALKKVDETFVDQNLKRISEVRNVGVESLSGYKKMIMPFISQPSFDAEEWATRQIYIALGNFMTAAAAIGIDTCPMEGLNPSEYDQILGLKGWATKVACAVGYRSQADKYATLPKVRFEKSAVIQYV